MKAGRRILVVGSSDLKTFDKSQRKEYLEACTQMGRALAGAGHTIVLGSRSDDNNKIDRSVVEGANAVGGDKHSVVVSAATKQQFPFEKEAKDFPQLDFKWIEDKGPWWGRVFQVKNAEAVVPIGGGEGTYQTGICARALERPILAIPSFGGGAEKVWKEIHSEYEHIPGLGDDPLKLQTPWDSSKADLAVRMVERLLDANTSQPARTSERVQALVAVVALLAAWLFLFCAPFHPRPVSFLLILSVSAVVGTAMRSLTKITSDPNAQISGAVLVTEAATGLTLSFGLMLVYLAGGLTISGDSGFLDHLDQDAGFRRNAVVFSVLGVAGAFTMERAKEKISSWFGKISSGDK